MTTFFLQGSNSDTFYLFPFWRREGATYALRPRLYVYTLQCTIVRGLLFCREVFCLRLIFNLFFLLAFAFIHVSHMNSPRRRATATLRPNIMKGALLNEISLTVCILVWRLFSHRHLLHQHTTAAASSSSTTRQRRSHAIAPSASTSGILNRLKVGTDFWQSAMHINYCFL